MESELYRCAAVFTAQNILVYRDGRYDRAIISGKIDNQVLVGDYLACEMVYGQLYVNGIVRRKNRVSRLQTGKIQGLAANVDITFIMTSANQDFNLARLERYYILAKEGGTRICFVLSKTDLTDRYEELAGIISKRFSECPVEKTSIYQVDSEKVLYNHWHENETAIFLGSSGVGKSSLINRMLKDEVIRTGDIRKGDDRGHHTTTARHIYILPNKRVVIDTPGLRSVGISANADTLDELFPEIKELESKCKYKNCSHLSESGCAIQEALEREELDYNRYLRYLKLVGAEQRRQILLKGKEYEKESLIKELKASRKNKRK
ncbi:MAG: ribosome small subunit-dependent GTPase A [Lachnospiraceae bacterium]|nr:ribosome small subunit-dependent GTPase A [uncultured Acetatifactor sp.]MCI8543733.1 ribosome small subunit-dependent GTPase A [Lachnospiraceae bacterium]